MTLTTTRIGRRTYIEGQTYDHRDSIRAAGAHWDSVRRAWWLGDDSTAQQLVSRLSGLRPPTDAQQTADRLARDRDHILGRAKYQGHDYYLVGQGRNDRGEWVRLMFRDGSHTFFAAASAVQITTEYREPKTLAGLQAYAARMARAAKTGECGCRCHTSMQCECPAFCAYHHDTCDYCGCFA